MSKKALLMILDGWGIGDQGKDDVIFNTPTPYWDSLLATYPHSQLQASGENVGLPDGQMGNSEVGHLNIGAGRIVYQDLVKINRACADNSIMKNPEIVSAFSYAKDCLGNQILKFNIQEYDDYSEMFQALQEHEIDMIFYAGRNPDIAEKKGYALTNTAWTYNLMAVTDEKNFDEGNVYTVAVPKEKEALKQQLTFSYPQWNLVDYDSFEEAAEMITNEKADCFLMGASQAMVYDNNRDFKSVPLTKTMEACFAVRGGEGTLLSILNKTLKGMPSGMLISALAIYDSTADKVTFSDFVKDNMLAFFATAGFFVLSIIGYYPRTFTQGKESRSCRKACCK